LNEKTTTASAVVVFCAVRFPRDTSFPRVAGAMYFFFRRERKSTKKNAETVFDIRRFVPLLLCVRTTGRHIAEVS